MEEPKKNPIAVAFAKMRSTKLSARRGEQIAKKAAMARWNQKKP